MRNGIAQYYLSGGEKRPPYFVYQCQHHAQAARQQLKWKGCLLLNEGLCCHRYPLGWGQHDFLGVSLHSAHVDTALPDIGQKYNKGN